MADRALQVPSWVTDGWFASNPEKQRFAMARYHMPVTTAAERELARAFATVTAESLFAVSPEALPSMRAYLETLIDHVRTPTYACTVCGQFAFAAPRICFWCAGATAAPARREHIEAREQVSDREQGRGSRVEGRGSRVEGRGSRVEDREPSPTTTAPDFCLELL